MADLAKLWVRFTRLLVMEAFSDAQVSQLLPILRDHIRVIESRPSFQRADLLAEEDGRMIIFQVTFDSRPALMEYHKSREYTQLLMRISHLLVGDPVVKLFRAHETEKVGA